MSIPSLPVTPVSAVACEAVLCRQGGALFATVVVKATFQLVHGEAARPIAPIALVRRDQPNAEGGSLVAARETAPHLPGAGVVLTGHAHAPDGRAVPSMSVRLGISRERPLVDRTLHVFGSRAATNPSAVMPFQKMPLVYERAFGGAGVWENPVGTGGPGSRALPNIVDPKDPKRPAGFAAVAGGWAPRRGLLGGAEPATLEQAIFDPPRGFDWRYFQAAPVDQQLDGFRGDEWIVLDGMHPSLTRVQSRLPQVKALARRGRAGSPIVYQPVELRADMLVIDADSLVASLVWRGRFAVESAEALQSIRVLAGVELPGRAIEWPAAAQETGRPAAPAAPKPAAPAAPVETQAVNLAELFAGPLPFSKERESVLPATPKPAAQPFSTGTAMVDVSKILREPVPFAEAAATSALPAVVLGGNVPVTATAAVPAVSVPSTSPVPFVAADPSRPSAASFPTPSAAKGAPMFTGTTDVNVAELMKGLLPLRGAAGPVVEAHAVIAATIPVVDPAPAPVAAAAPVVAPAPVAAPAPVVAPAPVMAPVPVMAPLLAAAPTAGPGPVADTSAVRAAVLERLQAGQSLDGLKLVSADLQEIDFKGASLAGLDFYKAKLARAKLAECRLSDARLVAADLTGADLTGADLGRADLSRAALDGARFNGAILIGAKLAQARGKGASFEGARLAQADLQGAELHEAGMLDIDAPESIWDKASLVGSKLLGAKLRGASLQRATLNDVCFSQADLTSANFQRATGTRADFRAARLEAADLRQAQLQDATFDDAEMRDLSGTKADLSGGRFFRADLSAANLRAAKLTGADFLHAKLDGADLRDADVQGIKIDPAVARAAKIRLPR